MIKIKRAYCTAGLLTESSRVNAARIYHAELVRRVKK